MDGPPGLSIKPDRESTPTYGALARDVAATSLSVAPGATALFGTGASVNVSVGSLLGSLPNATNSARVLATSKNIGCTAFMADDANVPPASGWQLTIIAKTKQKAAN